MPSFDVAIPNVAVQHCPVLALNQIITEPDDLSYIAVGDHQVPFGAQCQCGVSDQIGGAFVTPLELLCKNPLGSQVFMSVDVYTANFGKSALSGTM